MLFYTAISSISKKSASLFPIKWVWIGLPNCLFSPWIQKQHAMIQEIAKINFPANAIKAKRENILRLLGSPNNEFDPVVVEMADAQIKYAQELISPEGGFAIHELDDLQTKEGLLAINNTVFEVGRIIAAQLKKSDHIAVFACTIGNRLEKRSKELMAKGDVLEGYILDLVGSEAAEETASSIHQNAASLAGKNGMGHTNRFSPGYCNWDVKEQFKLFGFFPDGFCGIRLTESALMNPIKSVSGIIGLGVNAKFGEYNCSKCSDENCLYRNRK